MKSKDFSNIHKAEKLVNWTLYWNSKLPFVRAHHYENEKASHRVDVHDV